MIKERPKLPGLIKENTTVMESFQNAVLRPVIKMQHTLLIAFFKNYIEKRKVDFAVLQDDKKKEKIKAILENDAPFKQLLLGSILGHFTVDEFTFYSQNSSEINKRILQIILRRFQDSVSEI